MSIAKRTLVILGCGIGAVFWLWLTLRMWVVFVQWAAGQ